MPFCHGEPSSALNIPSRRAHRGIQARRRRRKAGLVPHELIVALRGQSGAGMFVGAMSIDTPIYASLQQCQVPLRWLLVKCAKHRQQHRPGPPRRHRDVATSVKPNAVSRNPFPCSVAHRSLLTRCDSSLPFARRRALVAAPSKICCSSTIVR
jgi:hypothetical protein